jgi:6,7-dimethyl-8-ribityllumazine synthase
MGEKGSEPDLSGADLHVAVIVSRYNEDVTRRLLRGALSTLEERGVGEPDVFLGCVIRGETFHFEVVAGQAAAGVMQVQLDTGVPVAFGVLTTEDKDQAMARSGPKNNKGAEAADAAIEMANLLRSIQG